MDPRKQNNMADIVHVNGHYVRTHINRLVITPKCDAASETPPPASPLVAGQTQQIHLQRVNLPSTYGKKTLTDAIIEACDKFDLTIESTDTLKFATFTPIAVALGKADNTSTSYIPAYDPRGQTNDILAISLAADGSGKIQSTLTRFHERPYFINTLQQQNNSIVIFAEINDEQSIEHIFVYAIDSISLSLDKNDIDAILDIHHNGALALMQQRVNLTQSNFSHAKVHDHEHTLSQLKKCIPAESGIDAEQTKILIHAFFQLAEVEESLHEDFAEIELYGVPHAPQFTFIKSRRWMAGLMMMAENLQEKFGDDFCELLSTTDQYEYYAIRFSNAAIMQHLSEFKSGLSTILKCPRNLQAYQQYQKGIKPACLNLKEEYSQVLKEVGMPATPRCIATLLLFPFDLEEDINFAEILPGEDYIAKMTDTCFKLDITETEARSIVDNINQELTCTSHLSGPIARFHYSETDLESECELSVISIDSDFLRSNLAKFMLRGSASKLKGDNPALIRDLRYQNASPVSIFTHTRQPDHDTSKRQTFRIN